MTLYEWKITDLGNGQYGYIWIAEGSWNEAEYKFRVWVDAHGLFNHFDYWNKRESNMLANCEQPNDWYAYKHILTYWQSLGSPRIDQKAPGREAPWFPWRDAGFTDDERDGCLGL